MDHGDKRMVLASGWMVLVAAVAWGGVAAAARAEVVQPPVVVRGMPVEVDGVVWRYCVKDGGASVVGGGPEEGDVAIPRRLDGWLVTDIGADAFSNRTGWTSVTLPESIRNVGPRAFAGCNHLTAIRLPYGLADIRDMAFGLCSRLAEVAIPDSVTNIEKWAFAECGSLTTVTIPDGMRFIGNSAFIACTGLESVRIGAGTEEIESEVFGICPKLVDIQVDERNPNHEIEDGVLLTRAGHDWRVFPEDDGRSLMFVPRNRQGEYAVPDGVVRILSMSFGECKDLQRVSVPDSVQYIEPKAFWRCEKLESIHFGNGLRCIGSKSFLECGRLASLVIPDSVEVIEDHAFCLCKNLKSVTMGEGVKRIGWNAFGKSGLEVLHVPAAWKGTRMLKSAGVPEGCRVVYGEEEGE